MPIFQAFSLFFLLVCVNAPGQAQDSVADDPAQPTSKDVPVPAAGESPAESLVSAEEGSLVPPSGPLNLYSPDVLVDMPYVYPLMRMRLTPEMRQGTP